MESRSQKSHATDLSRTFLKAHTILSNPFLPCNMDGSRKFSSITEDLGQTVTQIGSIDSGNDAHTESFFGVLSPTASHGFPTQANTLKLLSPQLDPQDPLTHQRNQ